MTASRTTRRLLQSAAAITFALSAFTPVSTLFGQQATQAVSPTGGTTRAQQFFAILDQYNIPAAARADVMQIFNETPIGSQPCVQCLARSLGERGVTPQQLQTFLTAPELPQAYVLATNNISSGLFVQASALTQQFNLPPAALYDLLPLVNNQQAFAAALAQRGLTPEQIQQFGTAVTPLIAQAQQTGVINFLPVYGTQNALQQAGLDTQLVYQASAFLNDPAGLRAELERRGLNAQQIAAATQILAGAAQQGLTAELLTDLTVRDNQQGLANLGLPPSALYELVQAGSDEAARRAVLEANGIPADQIDYALRVVNYNAKPTPEELQGFATREINRLLDSANLPAEALPQIASAFAEGGADAVFQVLTERGLSAEQQQALLAQFNNTLVGSTLNNPRLAEDAQALVGALAEGLNAPQFAGDQVAEGIAEGQLNATDPVAEGATEGVPAAGSASLFPGDDAEQAGTGTQTGGGEASGGEASGGEQPGGEQPGGEQPGGEQPGGEQSGGGEAGGGDGGGDSGGSEGG